MEPLLFFSESVEGLFTLHFDEDKLLSPELVVDSLTFSDDGEVESFFLKPEELSFTTFFSKLIQDGGGLSREPEVGRSKLLTKPLDGGGLGAFFLEEKNNINKLIGSVSLRKTYLGCSGDRTTPRSWCHNFTSNTNNRDEAKLKNSLSYVKHLIIHVILLFYVTFLSIFEGGY